MIDPRASLGVIVLVAVLASGAAPSYNPPQSTPAPAITLMPGTTGTPVPSNPFAKFGHLAIQSRESMVFVKTDATSVTFTAILPRNWSYIVDIDNDKDGIWGDGPDDKAPKAEPKTDFYFGSQNGSICTGYVYASDSDNPDTIYSSSECGKRKSSATYALDKFFSGGDESAVYVIPKTELGSSPSEIHFAIEIWDGQSFQVYGSPAIPLEVEI